MASKRRILPLLLALLIWENLNSIHASSESPSSAQSTSELSTSLPLKNTETLTPSVIVDEIDSRKKAIATGPRDKTRLRDPPGSPVKLFMPDEFQFYTLNGYGQLVMKQMTKQEIQGMIAASVGGGGGDGGDSFVEPGKQHPIPLNDDVPKVSDVVQNVQKVLKGELNKPVQVHPSSSSIPGSVNSQWTNMLPYILSGGSVDQQDVSQDTSIILPTLDADQSYIDVVPLQGGKPANDHYEAGSNYVQLQPGSNDQEIKLVTKKPTSSTSEKPIYLLGNMALDSDILGEQETYTLPTKDRPNRPVLTSIYQKFTTTKPFVSKDTTANFQNLTNDKPTLYIPVSVSPTLHNQNNHGQQDIYKIPGQVLKPNQEKHTTLGNYEADSTTIDISSKKTTAYAHVDEAGFARVPMIQVPVISAEKIVSSTQRINQQKTPMFEIFPTISPGSLSSTKINEGSYATKINSGPIDGFKKYGTNHRPSTSYHSVYESVTKPSSISFTSASSHHAIHEIPTKLNILNITSSTYRPIYQPITKSSTVKFMLSTHRPVFESITKPNTVNSTLSSNYNLVNEVETKLNTTTLKSESSQSIYETSTKSIHGLKITQYPSNTYQIHTTEKSSLSVPEIVINKNTQNMELNMTKSPTKIQDTIIKNQEKNQPLVHMIQKIPEYEKYSNISFVSKNTENTTMDLLKTPSYNNSQINQIIGLTTSNLINNHSHNTGAYDDTIYKLMEKTTENSEWNKVFYETDENNVNTYSTIVSFNTEIGNKVPTINHNITKNLNQSDIANTIKLNQDQMKTEKYNKYEESSTDSSIKIQIQESKTENSHDYYTPTIQKSTTEHSEIMYTQTDNIPIEVRETVIPNFDRYPIKKPYIGELKNQNQSFSSVIPDKPEKVNKDSYMDITLNNTTEQSLNIHVGPNEINRVHVNDSEKIQSWIPSEITTQFIPIDEATTEYNIIKNDFDEMKKPISNIYEEVSVNTQESTVIPFKDNNITYHTDIDSIVEYSTQFNKIIDSSYVDYYSKQPSSENQTIKPTSTSNETSIKRINTTTDKISENSVIQSDNIDLKKPIYDNTQVVVENSIATNKYSIKNLNDTITTPVYTSNYEIKPTNYDNLTTMNFVNNNQNKDLDTEIYFNKPSLDTPDSIIANKNSQIVLSINKNKTLPLNLNTFVQPIDNSNTKSKIKYSTTLPNISSIESNFDRFDSFNIGNSTTANENIEVVTEEFSLDEKENDKSNKYTTKIITNRDKIKVSLQEDEVSTIKVIPVYDDDTSMYTLSLDNSNETTPKITSNIKLSENIKNSFNITKSTNLTSNKLIQMFRPVNQQEHKSINQTNHSVSSSVTTISSTPNYITQNIPSYNTILPGLRETFNNYLKENYDSKLTTTNKYNEISHLTTFSTIIDKISSNDTNKSPNLITLDRIKINVPEHQIIQQKVQSHINLITTTPKDNDSEPANDFSSTLSYSLENLDSITKNTISKEIYSTEYLDDNSPSFTTKYPETSNKNHVETPIIYLDLANRDSDKQSISYQLNNNRTNSSSFTRIKIKNPISDIEKIITEAQFQSNNPSTVHYALSNYHKAPNTIASGLIAGYPTYNQIKSTTEYVTDTTFYDNVSESSSSSTNKDSAHFTLNKNSENVLQNDKNFSYQEKSTTLLLENDRNYIEKTSSIPIYMSAGEETSTYNYETFEVTNYEPYTSIPLESLSTFSKTEIPSQTEEKYDSPLEKISDLINQLKDKPPEHDPIEHEYSSGVTTTIIPLERFETIIDENNSTPVDDTLTTILDKINKTSITSRNNTYVAIHTLSNNKPYQSSTESADLYNTIKKQNIVETTTHSLKIKPGSGTTTLLTVMKQPVTEKPHVTSTYSTTKGLLEKTQSTIDKSAGRINLEDEKNKMQKVKPTEPAKFTMKNKIYYSTDKRPTSESYQGYTRKTTRPVNKSTTVFTKDYTTSKPIGITKESNTDKWTLIPQKNIAGQTVEMKQPSAISKEGAQQLNPQIVTLDHATGAIGLDQSSKGLDKDVAEFLNMCNELSFKFWTLANSELSSSRSVTLSPFGMISTLAMIFLGARGLTSNQMNDILKLDDVVTFNPHLVFQNITDTVTLARGQGIQNAAFVRALFADRLKVRKIMPFYKEQAQQFYEGAVVDINFSTAGDILRRRTNLLIRKQTGGRIKDFVKTHTVPLRSPLTALSANVFQTSCDSPDASSDGRDGEMYFAVSQTVKQRKLVPIPAVVWKSGVSAGYEPSLDATAVALGDPKRPVSLIMVMPGQQGLTAAGDNLERLEHRLLGNPSENALEKLLKVIVPRRVEVQMPKFSHRSIVNITSALKKLGFDQLFTKTADLKGINGAGHDLYLADMLQMNLFYTCGDENKLSGRPLSETFPGTSSRQARAWEIINNVKTGINDYLENNESDDIEVRENSKYDSEDDCRDSLTVDDSSGLNESVEVLQSQLPLLRKGDTDRINNLKQKLHKKRLWWLTPMKHRRCRNRRQAEIEKPRMKMDKPFLYLIRHNLTGLILHIGRFNPKNQS